MPNKINISDIEKFKAFNVQKSEGTTRTYLHHLTDYADYLEPIKKNIRDASEDDLVNYISKKNKDVKAKSEGWESARQKMSSNSIMILFSALTKFYHILKLIDKEEMVKNVRKDMLGKTKNSSKPFSLNHDEIKELLKIPVHGSYYLIERDNLIIHLLYVTGMRVSEVSNLTIDKIDLNSKDNVLVEIKGKRKKIRYVLITKEWIKRYKEWYEDYRHDNEQYAFLNKNNGRLSTHAIWDIVKEKAKRAFGGKGIIRDGKAISTHKLRSTFATEMLRNGIPLLITQELLGHDSADTTKKYTQIDPNDLKKIETLKVKL